MVLFFSISKDMNMILRSLDGASVSIVANREIEVQPGWDKRHVGANLIWDLFEHGVCTMILPALLWSLFFMEELLPLIAYHCYKEAQAGRLRYLHFLFFNGASVSLVANRRCSSTARMGQPPTLGLIQLSAFSASRSARCYSLRSFGAYFLRKDCYH